MKLSNITGHVILIMGPTGSGKGSLIQHVKEKFLNLRFLVSCTTRDPRPGEENGVQYYYISQEEFDKKIKQDEFLEWAEFSGNRYGTLKSEILEPLRTKEVVLNEIELQGVQSLIEIIPKEHRTIVYIEAGDWETLKIRALARAPISDDHLQLRHQRYLEEVKSKPHADIVIDNFDGMLDDAKTKLEKIVRDIFEKVK
ncbi:hypothetical protein N8083_01090 [Candidatus Pacebacteria bacterium]|nr:hypothetical protein [Candidatus Paceibacterota bacterium]